MGDQNTEDIFVTGGAGFIGSHIVESLIEDGYNVTVYDNLSTGTLDNLNHLSGKFNFVQGDIRDFDQVLKAMKGHDIVSHQAAQLEITTAMDDPQIDLEVNAEGSLNVFDAATENEISKVIYASSACVYGQAESVPQSEEHPTKPNWPYGVSKLAVDKYADIYSKVHEIPFVGLRYGITYGPREWFGRVMTVFLKRALNGEPPVVWGGEQERDFVQVSDAARLHNAVIEANIDGSTVFNVGTGVATSIDELASLVVETTGINQEIIYEDVGQGEKSQEVERNRLPQELNQMVLDCSKAERELNWVPRVSLREGLEKQYTWIQDNNERWGTPSY